jgi:putative hydrolase of HD superfamily
MNNKRLKNSDLKSLTNFLFEVGILAKTPRSGFHFLGTGAQSVAEHTSRAVYIGYVLASIMEVDVFKVLKMCLFHDLGEARTSDLNYIHQMYVTKQERKAISDSMETLSFGNDVEKIIDEFENKKTMESIVAKDADNLEWILSLKEQSDAGNERADDWIVSAVKRLKTPIAKELAKVIIKTDSNAWWFGDKQDSWWVNRDKKKSKIRWNK